MELADTLQRDKQRLIQAIESNPRAYSYFQAVRLLHQLLKGQNITLTVTPEASLDFPSSHISSLEEDDNHHLHITTTFLGLYGISSPLPTFYTEMILYDLTEDVTAVKHFLDIFHAMLYPLFYKAWEKYRLAIQLRERRNASVRQILYCLSGLGYGQLRPSLDRPDALLRYAGMLINPRRPLYGLRAILADYFQVPVQVKPFHEAKQFIPKAQYCRLGQANNHVAHDCHIGQQVRTRRINYLVQIGPLSTEQFSCFLPLGEHYSRLKQLIDLYTNQALNCFVEVELKDRAFEGSHLGAETVHSRLGLGTWLKGIDVDKTLTVRYLMK